MKIKTLTFRCRYWRPGTDFVSCITSRLRGQVIEGDVLLVSEKAISTASGNLVDESTIKPGKLAWF
ncbi:hypothetical protein E2P71_02270, partial [Candidatus Bathyarchaeota archaeon]